MKETNNIPLPVKVFLAILALSWLVIMGWAAGDAWEHDGEAHSAGAFGGEYEYQGEQ